MIASRSLQVPTTDDSPSLVSTPATEAPEFLGKFPFSQSVQNCCSIPCDDALQPRKMTTKIALRIIALVGGSLLLLGTVILLMVI